MHGVGKKITQTVIWWYKMNYLEQQKKLFLEVKSGFEKSLLVAVELFLGIMCLSILVIYVTAFFTGVVTVGGFVTLVVVFTMFKKFLKN